MKKFEEKLDGLKKIVGELETGNIPLDESLEQFEAGIELIKDCHAQLEEFKSKVSLLIENSNGSLEFKEFNADRE